MRSRRLSDFPKSLVALAVASVLVPEGHAGTVSWGSGGDGFWDVASNWSGAAVPSDGSDVRLTTAGKRVVTYQQDVTTLKSLTIGTGNTLAVTGGTPSAGTLANAGAIGVYGGEFDVSGGSSGAMTLSGGVTKVSGTLNATGAITLQGGTLTGGTIQQSGGNGLVFTNGAGTLDGVTVRGTMNVGDAATPYGAAVRISNGLSVQIESGGSPGVINVGTYTDASGYGNGAISFTGTQTFDNVTLNLGNTGPYSGSSYVALDGDGTFTLGTKGVIQGAGNVGAAYFGGGTANIVNNGTISANLNGPALNISNSGTLTNNGVLRAVDGGTLNITPGGNWTNAGVIRVADASSTINLGGTLTVGSLGKFDNAAGGHLNLTGTLANTGTTLTFSPSTGSISLVGGTITGGTIQESGSNGLLFTGSGTLDGVTVRGTLNVGNANNSYYYGSSVRINNGLTVQSELGESPGVINVGTTPYSSGYYNSGNLGFTGTQTLDNVTLNIGSANAGYQSYVSLDGGGTFTLGAKGVIQGAGSVGQAFFEGGTNNIVNNGTISANIGGGYALTINNSGTLTNNGVLSAINGGTLNITPTGNWGNAGVIRVVDADSTVNLGGTLTVGSLGKFDNAVGGKLNLTGTLANTGTTLAFTPSTGSMSLVGGTIIGGTVQQSGSNGLVFTSSAGVLDGATVRGALNVGDATNNSYYGSSVRISNGLTVLSEAGAAPGVINVGTGNYTSGYYNTGTIGFTGTQTLDNATLNLGTASGGYQSYVSLDAGGTFTLGTKGVIQGAGSLGQAYFEGGTNNLINNGTISANLSIGTLNINNSGTLTNNGVLSAINGGTLNITPTGNWSNAGVIRVVDADSTINLGGTLTVGSLGKFDNAAGGKLNLNGTLTNTGTTLTFTPSTGSISLAGGTITGGAVQQSGSNGLVFTSSGGVLDGVTVRGALNIGDASNPTNSAVRISNGLTVLSESGGSPGVINVGPATNGYGNVIGFTGTQTLDNATINLGSKGYYSYTNLVSLDGGGTFTLGAKGVIQGTGNVGQASFEGGTNNFVNNGAIRANGDVALTINNSGTLTNNGVLSVDSNSTLSIQSAGNLTNFGGTTLTGGTYNVAGTLEFAGANIVTNAATIVLDGSGSLIRSATDGTNALANFAVNTKAGSFTIQNGRDFTTAGAFSNGGTVGIGASSTFTTTGTFSNLAGAQTQLAGGTLAATKLSNAGTLSGFGTVSPAVANTGSVLASGGALTLSAGVQGTSGTVGVAAGSTLTLGATSTAAKLDQNGTLALGSHNITVSGDYTNANTGSGNSYDRRAGVTGSGQILAAGTTQQTLSGTAVQNGTASVATLALANSRVGQGSATASYTINDTGSGGTSLRGAIQTSGITNAALSGSGVTAQNWGAVTQGGTGQTLTVSYSPTTAGALSGQSVKIVNNFDNVAGQTLQITGNAYNVAAASTIAPNPVTFTNRHVGDTATQALTVANTAPTGSFSEGMTASFSGTSGAATASGGVALLAAGASNSSSLVVGLDTSTAGAKSGTATVALASNGTGTSGLANLSLSSQTVAVSGSVYRLADAATVAPVSFGNVHVGDSVSRSLTIGNVATNDGFSEGLTATFGSASDARITTSGSVSVLGAGQTDASSMKVGLNTTAAGAVNGSVNVNFVSDGTGTSGLGTTALPGQAVAVSGVIQTGGSVYSYASASPASPNPVSLGNVRIGSTATQALTLTNTAPAGGYSESLDASIGGATAGVSAAGSFSQLAAQATNSSALTVGLNTSTAGAKSGTATITLASDGTGTSGLGTTALASQTVAISGNVYRVANPVISTPSITLAARVGDAAPLAAIGVSNASPDSYTERLNASIGSVSAGFNGSGSISGLAAGASSSAMTVGLNTATAGSYSGSASLSLVSSGAGTTGAADLALAGQSVALTGHVYTSAVATLGATSVDFGIVHVGDSVAAHNVAVTNSAVATAANDTLSGSLTTGSGAFKAGGTVSGLAAQTTAASALTVGLNTSTAGGFSSVATGTFASHNADMADLALGTQTVAISAQVNNYADVAIASSGAGALSQTGHTYVLDFGSVVLGSAILGADLSLFNSATGFADLLSGNYDLSMLGSEFTLSGFGSFTGLVAGSSIDGLTIAFDDSTAGFYETSVVLHASGSNASGYIGALADTTLVLRGNVTNASVSAVPEPGTYVLMFAGLLMVVGAGRLRRPQAERVRTL